MLLIIVLVQIATSTLVSSECDHGTMKVKDFDWNKFSGPRPWYTLLHTSNDFESSFECLKVLILSPLGNSSVLANEVFVKSEQRHTVFYGYATNWNSTGYYEIRYTASMWNGRVYIKAVDYDRYFIGKLCPFNLNQTYVYVMYRSKHPDEATVKDVLKELQDDNIDISQFVDMTSDNCQ